MEDVTKCQKCSQTCVDPRILRCFHTFCLGCLERMRSDGKTGEQMPCPRCGTVTIIPAEGFRENEFVKRLNRVAALSKPIEKGIVCDACKDYKLEPKQVVATAFCLECQNNLCEECCKMHGKQKPSRNHQLLSFGGLSRSELETKFDLDFCDQHEMIPLEKYCEICKMVICNICLAESHKTHQCSDIRVAKDRLQRLIYEEVDKLDSLSNRGLVTREDLEKKKMNFMEEIEFTETAVKTCGQKLKDLIDQHTAALLGDIGKCQREGLERLNRQRTYLDLHAAIVSSFKTYCSSLCDKGSSYDVCSSVSQIVDRVKELKTENDLHGQRHIPLPTMTLEKADISEVHRMPNVIGEIKVTQQPEIVHAANLDFSGFSVMGVAKLRSSVYILCRIPQETVLNVHQQLNVIRVYSDQQPFTLNGEIKLQDMTSPFDMVASDSNDCLYVTDLNQVYEVTVDLKIRRFLKWKWSPHTLSVSTEGRVMLGKDDEPCCCLERYTSKAELVNRIQLPVDVVSVKHAVESPNGNVFVLLDWATDFARCCTVSTGGKGRHPSWKENGTRGLYEVTSAGKVVRWFSPRTQFYQLDDPRYLALDSGGEVFVADHGKDRLAQFDSELNLIQVIEKPGMFGPKRLFYDKAKQQLWIGHSKHLPTEEDVSGSINVCQIKAYIEQQQNSSSSHPPFNLFHSKGHYSGHVVPLQRPL